MLQRLLGELEKAYQYQRFTEKEEWMQWLQDLGVMLLKASPSVALKVRRNIYTWTYNNKKSRKWPCNNKIKSITERTWSWCCWRLPLPLRWRCVGVIWNVKLTRIMSFIYARYNRHTNNITYWCHKVTALAKEVASNLLGGETYNCISTEEEWMQDLGVMLLKASPSVALKVR